MYEKMRTKPLFGRGKLQKMLLVTRIGLLCILAFNITAAANVFSQAFNLKMKNVTLEEVLPVSYTHLTLPTILLV